MRIRRTIVSRAPLALVPLLLAVVLILVAPASAEAYSMPHVSIAAEVEADGTLRVTEQRTFDFDDDVNGVYWDIARGANQQGVNPIVDIDEVTEEANGSSTSYRPVESASNGDAGVYTVETDADKLRLKVFTPHVDGDESTFTVTYHMNAAVMAWRDTAELYWKFIGDGWSEDSEDVQLTVTFAAAATSGVAGKTGEAAGDDANFRAWGHGPLNGDVSLDAAAPSVALTVPRVQSGEFAEVRAVFPTAWIPQLTWDGASTGQVDGSGDRLPVVLSQEKEWADRANEQRAQARTLALVAGVVAIAAPALFLVIVVLARLKVGPKPRATFAGTYFRDVPSDDHPAVIAAFMNGGSVGNRALVATLMKLTDDKVVAVSKSSTPRKTLFGGERIDEDYVLAVPEGGNAKLTDAIDRAALKIYFADDGGQIAFSRMQSLAKDDPKGFAERWKDFQAEVGARYEERDLVASTGVGAGIAGVIFGVITGMLSLIFSGVAGWPAAAVAGIAMAVVGVIVSWTFKRDTVEGAELRARCRALKKWFEDFTRLGEAVPGDVILWNRLLVLAVALGVSERVLEELAAATPASYDDGYAGGGYYPAWWWCTGHGGLGSPVSSMSSVSELALSEIASSSDSSSGGFGGGFSGGGGGGTGGGGGGTF